MTTPGNWSTVAIINDRYVVKHSDNTYESTDGEPENWIWTPASKYEIDEFENRSLLAKALDKSAEGYLKFKRLWGH